MEEFFSIQHRVELSVPDQHVHTAQSEAYSRERNLESNNSAFGLIKDTLSFNCFIASGNICRLLITFANSLDPCQDRQNVCQDLDLNHLNI